MNILSSVVSQAYCIACIWACYKYIAAQEIDDHMQSNSPYDTEVGFFLWYIIGSDTVASSA